MLHFRKHFICIRQVVSHQFLWDSRTSGKADPAHPFEVNPSPSPPSSPLSFFSSLPFPSPLTSGRQVLATPVGDPWNAVSFSSRARGKATILTTILFFCIEAKCPSEPKGASGYVSGPTDTVEGLRHAWAAPP